MESPAFGHFLANFRRFSQPEARFKPGEPYRASSRLVRQPATAADFRERTGLSTDTIAGRLAAAEQNGMIEAFDGPGWRPTALGSRFLNELAVAFLP